MDALRQSHRVQGGILGFLRAVFGIGVHQVMIFDDRGQLLGRGEGATEGAAREQAWRKIREKN